MEVAEALGLIEKIIEEHRIILGGIQDFTQSTTDVAAMRGISQAQQKFVPGRLEDQLAANATLAEELDTETAGQTAEISDEIARKLRSLGY